MTIDLTATMGLRQKADDLRRRILEASDAAPPELVQELRAADEAWRKAADATAPAGDGVLLSSRAQIAQKMGIETTGIDATVTLRMSHVPTGVVHLLEKPLVEVALTYGKGTAQYARVRVACRVDGYSSSAVDTVELKQKTPQSVLLSPTFFPATLKSVNEMTRATLHVELENLDTKLVERHSSFPIWLLARTSAYLSVRDPKTGERIDLTRYLGAWVTPNARAVMDMLRGAADKHAGHRIVGYQVDEAGIEAQVKAMYDALHERGLVYVNSVLTSGGSNVEFFQRVRLPAESIEVRSANCLDGTVLMASLLEAASLDPAVVLIPGHAFLAWKPKRDDDATWSYLETTLIADGDFAKARKAAERSATNYQALAAEKEDPRFFRRLSLRDLRASGITPME